MKKTIWITIIVVALTAIISVSAFASAEPEHLAIFKDLQLTEAQKEKIAAIRQTIKDDPQYRQLKNKMMELRKLKDKKPVDPKQMTNQWKMNPELKAKYGAKMKSMFEQIKKILTPKQLATLQAKFQRYTAGKKGSFIAKIKHNLEQPNQLATAQS